MSFRLIDEWMRLNGFTVTNFYDGGADPPSTAGVYAFTTTKAVYVGSSANIANRLRYHEVKREVESCLIWWKPTQDFMAEETAMIRELRPALNVIHNGNN
jgi:excinuclease UvrABC nuclease subunit